MMNSFQFCSNFAFEFNLRRYNTVEAGAGAWDPDEMVPNLAHLVAAVAEAGAYTRALLSST
jgi:hypothetical protein